MDAEELAKCVVVLKAEVEEGEGEALRDELLERAQSEGVDILILGGDMVFGEDHVRSAVYHARKAVDEGRNSSDSLAMEAMLYASGERQLGSAIKKMTVTAATRTVVLVVLQGRLEPGPGWQMMGPDEGPPDRARLSRFGLTDEAMDTVGPDKLRELVLERVAAVDVIKR